MMRLSVMWHVDRATDAKGTNPVAARLAERWDHDPRSVRHARASANFVYVCSHDQRRRFLRFASADDRSREEIEAEIDLVAWLARAGLAVARPIPSRGGALVETATTELGAFHAVMFEGLDGAQLVIEDLDPPRFRAWGAAMGRLHAALHAYPGTAASARWSWRDHLALAERFVPRDAAAVRVEMDQIAVALDALPVRRDTFGPIHFDFELDNLRWRDHAIAILDFDDCARYWYAADIAFALGDLFDCGNRSDGRFRAFVRGYAAHFPIDAEMLSQIPLFRRMAALVRHARLLRAMDLSDDEEYPEWLQALRRKLAQRIASYPAALESRWR